MKKLLTVLLTALLVFSFTACSVPTKEREYAVNEYRTTMQFYDNFKILQLTDLHLGIESDLTLQLNVVKNAIRSQKPDLVILTGDNFMYATKSVVRNLVKTLNDECKALTQSRNRLTKFAVTFGNHDNQGDYPRYYINSVLKSYTTADGKEIEEGKFGTLRDFEDDNIFGLTNYFIDLVDDRNKNADEADVLYRLHIIDSNSYHFGGVKYGYDIIRQNQLDHAQKIYQTATTDKDYIGMAFLHIPFVEYETAKQQYENATDPSTVGQGKFGEEILPPHKNNGAYHKLRDANIISFFVGHNHKNYGDFIYNAHSDNLGDKAIFSFGVKSTNQLYHFEDMMGYKIVTLKKDMTAQEFLSIENIRQNFINNTNGSEQYA